MEVACGENACYVGGSGAAAFQHVSSGKKENDALGCKIVLFLWRSSFHPCKEVYPKPFRFSRAIEEWV
jgi:hypothetical protein